MSYKFTKLPLSRGLALGMHQERHRIPRYLRKLVSGNEYFKLYTKYIKNILQLLSNLYQLKIFQKELLTWKLQLVLKFITVLFKRKLLYSIIFIIIKNLDFL